MTLDPLNWELVQTHLGAGHPWLLSMGGSRGMNLGYDPMHERMYVQLPAQGEKELPIATFAELELRLLGEGAKKILEISTSGRTYHREFHRFATLLLEDFERTTSSALSSFRDVAERWRELLSVRTGLSAEQAMGLMGELLFLERLIDRDGPTGVMAWVARTDNQPDRHDFRLATSDVEVKTTRSTTRTHVVHGINQLLPAPNRELFILSFRFRLAGAAQGYSLPHLVSRIESRLKVAAASLQHFTACLGAAGYSSGDALLYRELLALADPPVLVPVDESCPRIIPAHLNSQLPPGMYQRIDQVSYRINLEGLGHPETSARFQQVLPNMRFT
jgi:hypothetical protein